MDESEDLETTTTLRLLELSETGPPQRREEPAKNNPLIYLHRPSLSHLQSACGVYIHSICVTRPASGKSQLQLQRLRLGWRLCASTTSPNLQLSHKQLQLQLQLQHLHPPSALTHTSGDAVAYIARILYGVAVLQQFLARPLPAYHRPHPTLL
jgi:hypothetical protein